MTIPAVLDAAGRRRSPATMPGYHAGRAPHNKGRLYPADPPTVEERRRDARNRRRPPWLSAARPDRRALARWLRVQEALALVEPDSTLDAAHCSCEWQGRPASRDRHGQPGAGTTAALAAARPSSPPVGCSASSMARRADDRGQAPMRASSFAGSPLRRESGVASRRTDCATPTPSSSRAKACP